MKKLYRSENNKVIAGVCAGLGEYFNVTPKLFRIAFVVGLLFGFFPSVVIYLIFWVVVESSPWNTSNKKNDMGNVVDVDPIQKSK
jgi:phage shock protein C